MRAAEPALHVEKVNVANTITEPRFVSGQRTCSPSQRALPPASLSTMHNEVLQRAVSSWGPAGESQNPWGPPFNVWNHAFTSKGSAVSREWRDSLCPSLRQNTPYPFRLMCDISIFRTFGLRATIHIPLSPTFEILCLPALNGSWFKNAENSVYCKFEIPRQMLVVRGNMFEASECRRTKLQPGHDRLDQSTHFRRHYEDLILPHPALVVRLPRCTTP